jgi:hypothetical protein
MDVFLSVGTGLNDAQEAFVEALETRLRGAGLVPHTLNRNEWSTLAPLQAINQLMDRCVGALILGLERYHFVEGVERPGSKRETPTGEVNMATSWNHIEATLAYSRGLPLFVIVDERVKAEGMLEPGLDWHVAQVPLDRSALQSAQFEGLLKDWCARLIDCRSRSEISDVRVSVPDPSKLSILQLLSAIRIGELWAIIVAIALVIGGVFTLGAKLGPVLTSQSGAAVQATSSHAGSVRGPANTAKN